MSDLTAGPHRWTIVAFSAALLMSQTAWSEVMPSAARAGVVIEQIGKLEGRRDPKCDATASRLEDFIYGTRLSGAARFAKNDRQKALASRIWSGASRHARQVGLREIPRALIDDARASLFGYRELADGHWQVELAGTAVRIERTDRRQYSTIAYALRAILAAEQDHQLEVDGEWLPLSAEAVEALKEAIDLFTLAVLQTADREARAADRYQVERQDLLAAWDRLLPAAVDSPPSSVTTRAPAAPDYQLLERTVAQKLASYEQYNQVSMQVFLRNLQVYFARHRWPDDPKVAEDFRALFTLAMVQFSRDLLQGAEEVALQRGHPYVRAEDVETFAKRFLPHRINEYEDAIFFPKLPRDRQIAIEAYDMDSFRDGGLHWRYLQMVIEEPGFVGRLAPDPFASELLVENIAQFGVLLLRESGRLSKAAGHERLHPDFINLALRAIQERIDASAAAAEPPAGGGALHSADDTAQPTFFVDATAPSGIRYMHRMADWLNRQLRGILLKSENVGQLTIPPAFQGSGVAAEDVDGDGLVDILLLGGLGNRLFRNRGDGSFEDVTEAAGLTWVGADGHPGESRQPIIADFDNDGHQDILITYANAAHRLYRNLGDGRFEDVTGRAGLGGEGLIGGPATAIDFDRDGLLDLYIGYFGDYLRGVLPTLARRNGNGLPNRLFRNLGDFRFADVTAGSGVDNAGWTQAVGHTDLDGDGWQDLIAGNDFGINAYYRNLGDGKFEDIAGRLGTDKPSFTMGIGIADLNADDAPDIYISNIVTMNKDEKYVLPDETTTMKLNPEKLANMRVVEANDLFLSQVKDGQTVGYALSDRVGRGYSSTGWAWDADFFDMDNDGDEDLYVLNGMNPYNVYGTEHPYFSDGSGAVRAVRFPSGDNEANVLFVNSGGRLHNVSRGSGVDLIGNSRAAAYLDFDQDGDLDIIVNNLQDAAVLYRNTAETLGNHWLSVRLTGDPGKGSTRDAIGARILVTSGAGARVWREVHSTVGYLSVHPKEQHFGVGKAERVAIEVRWPNGDVSRYEDVAADQRYRITQGAATPEPFGPGKKPLR